MAKKEKQSKKTEETRQPAPWRPFGDVEPWASPGEGTFPWRMGRLLDELLGEWQGSARAQAFIPAMDVSEDDAKYVVTVEIPGATRDDVKVEVRRNVLTISGEKKSEREEQKENRRYVERSFGSFSRSFTLPEDADEKKLDAGFKDGILTVSIPRTEESKSTRISIKG